VQIVEFSRKCSKKYKKLEEQRQQHFPIDPPWPIHVIKSKQGKPHTRYGIQQTKQITRGNLVLLPNFNYHYKIINKAIDMFK
jgi:phosphoketolase